ncbi:MAG: DUF1592 domain-containing protein [Rhodospirillaceae bacterium]
MKLDLSAAAITGLRKAAGYAALAAALLVAGCSAPNEDTATRTPTLAPIPEPASQSAAPKLRLISAEQYTNTLAHFFGPGLRIDPRFPPPPRTQGLIANGAASSGVSTAQLEEFQRVAALVSAQVVDLNHRAFLIGCTPKSDSAADQACAREFLAATGRRLFRRPMREAELNESVRNAVASATALKDFYAGLSVALEGLLLNPNTLYLAEVSEADPARLGHARLEAYSLAARLSFFLWNSGPDDVLLDAAESGEIHTARGRARLVDSMLTSPRLEAGMRAFFEDMMEFDRFQTLAKDASVYPFFTGITIADAREQTLRTLIDHLITNNLDYRDLFTTRKTYISQALAALYQVPATPGWIAYEFPPESPRAGLLTQVSFLAVHAHPGRSSPTLRGKALRETLLCQPVPRPPPNVDFSLVENPDASYPTQRDRVAIHLGNPVCAGCHKITDPTGLALENFDGAGRFRATERGVPIDASGALDGKAFQNVVELGRVLRDHPAVPSCLVQRLYSYGFGGAAPTHNRELLGYFNRRFADEGYKLPGLLRTIALSNAFSEVTPPAPQRASAAGR